MKMKVKFPLLRQTSIEVNINDTQPEFIAPIETTSPPGFKNLISQAGKALKKLSPTLVEEGISGTYLFHGENSKVLGVFKPFDEDGLSPSNPKGYSSPSVRRLNQTFVPGEAMIRECAAYLLDSEHFSGVPATELVLCSHPIFCGSNELSAYPTETLGASPMKFGSFQEYKQNDGSVEELGPSFYPVDEVHKIAVLDIRLANTDRHEGNILYHKKLDHATGECIYSLIPIDHAYSLPAKLSDIWFCWRIWPQAKQKMSPRTKAYILRQDVEKDIQLLQSKFPSAFKEKHFKIMRIMMQLLKSGVQYDLTFYHLASIICPSAHGQTSKLEEMVSEAEKRPEGSFFSVFSQLVNEHMFELSFSASMENGD